MSRTRIVTLGGGNGHSQLLSGIKNEPFDLTAVCTASDAGGSTGILSQEWRQSGVNGYVGDVTRCVCALSPDKDAVAEMMARFDRGSLAPHTVRNVLYAAMIRQHGPAKALSRLHEYLRIQPNHRVFPVSFERTRLEVRLLDGLKVYGENLIDRLHRERLFNPKHHAITDAWLKPAILALPEVLTAIKHADVLIVTPGDLFTSTVATLSALGIKRAIAASRAKLVFVLNIMTKRGETDGYTAPDFVRQLSSRTGRNPDVVVCNDNGIPSSVLMKYAREDKTAIVTDSLEGSGFHTVRLVRAHIWKLTEHRRIVHDPVKLGRTLVRVIRSFNKGS